MCGLPAVRERAHLGTERITHRTVEDMIAEVHSAPGASSARSLYRALSAAFGRAMRRGRCGPITVNPMLRVDQPKTMRQEPVVPAPASVAAVIAAASPEFAALLRVAIATGARRSELAAVEWSGVEW